MLKSMWRAAGGGRRVIRCEVSLDSGETWRRAEIERHEEPTPHNKTWCWVFWSIAVTAVELVRAPELRVRAVDSSQNMMPGEVRARGTDVPGLLCPTVCFVPELHLVIKFKAHINAISQVSRSCQRMLGTRNCHSSYVCSN